jgi:hypothetical protein
LIFRQEGELQVDTGFKGIDRLETAELGKQFFQGGRAGDDGPGLGFASTNEAGGTAQEDKSNHQTGEPSPMPRW